MFVNPFPVLIVSISVNRLVLSVALKMIPILSYNNQSTNIFLFNITFIHRIMLLIGGGSTLYTDIISQLKIPCRPFKLSDTIVVVIHHFKLEESQDEGG